jgi:hypothetical protein
MEKINSFKKGDQLTLDMFGKKVPCTFKWRNDLGGIEVTLNEGGTLCTISKDQLDKVEKA